MSKETQAEGVKGVESLETRFTDVDIFNWGVPSNIKPPEYKFRSEDLALYCVEEITYEEDSPRLEALENVFACMARPGVNFVYLIRGNKTGVHFYFGFMRDYSLPEDRRATDSILQMARAFLRPSLEGNFRGSLIKEVDKKESAAIQEDLVKSLSQKDHCCVMSGVPGMVQDKENQDFRGIDRLVDVMQGDDFGFMVLAKAIPQNAVRNICNNVFKVYEAFAPFVKVQTQEGGSKGTGAGTGEHHDQSKHNDESKGGGTGRTHQHTDGKNGEHWSRNDTEGGSSQSNWQKSWGNGTSDGISSHKDYSASKDWHVSRELTNKYAEDWVKYFDDVLIPRLDYGKGKGVFLVSTLLFGATVETVQKLSNAAKSIFSGDKANMVPLTTRMAGPNERKHLEQLQLVNYDYSVVEKKDAELIPYCVALLSIRPGTIANWMTSRELALMAGLPQKEVIGLRLKEEVEFGLNVPSEKKRKKSGNDNERTEGEIDLGKLVKSGNVCESVQIPLQKDQLDRHVFVAGVTGCGKTTTCQNILLGSGWPFMVIEPAKTEYRGLRKDACRDLLVFTLGDDTVAPFRLNPFELVNGESITTRVDMLMASISAAFEMEAAIPQLIERAIYASYYDKGWDVRDNTNRFYKNPFEDGVFAFPRLSDVLAKTEAVVNEQGFDDRLKKDYIGSIKARLQGLTLGAKGMMLDCHRSIDFDRLIDRKVVLELESIPNAQQKSLIIGFILTNLVQAIKHRYEEKGGKKVCHITLIEEAHRLLTKTEPGGNSSQRQAAETFADMLAEVRKYGESLIIADQIPSKLTPDVIKNTNTKIIHRLFAQDDKEAVGHTMALEDEQMKFLSSLKVGHAVVFNGAWSTRPVQVKINERHKTDSAIDKDEKSAIRNAALKFYEENPKRGELNQYSEVAEESDNLMNDLTWLIENDPALRGEVSFLKGGAFELHGLRSMCNRFGRDKVLTVLAKNNWDPKDSDEVTKLLKKIMCNNFSVLDVEKLRRSYKLIHQEKQIKQ